MIRRSDGAHFMSVNGVKEEETLDLLGYLKRRLVTPDHTQLTEPVHNHKHIVRCQRARTVQQAQNTYMETGPQRDNFRRLPNSPSS